MQPEPRQLEQPKPRVECTLPERKLSSRTLSSREAKTPSFREPLAPAPAKPDHAAAKSGPAPAAAAAQLLGQNEQQHSANTAAPDARPSFREPTPEAAAASDAAVASAARGGVGLSASLAGADALDFVGRGFGKGLTGLSFAFGAGDDDDADDDLLRGLSVVRPGTDNGAGPKL
jgi:hypothetical protein